MKIPRHSGLNCLPWNIATSESKGEVQPLSSIKCEGTMIAIVVAGKGFLNGKNTDKFFSLFSDKLVISIAFVYTHHISLLSRLMLHNS